MHEQNIKEYNEAFNKYHLPSQYLSLGNLPPPYKCLPCTLDYYNHLFITTILLEPFLSLLLLLGVGFWKEICVFFLLSLMGQGHSPLRVVKYYHHPGCYHVYIESCNHQISKRY